MYDIIIIGGGPSGLTAAVYAARYKLKTLVLSKNMGGTASLAHVICNFPSYLEIKGYELMQKMTSQVTDLGVEIKYNPVIKIENKKKSFFVHTEKEKFESKKVIYAGGTERTRLNVEGEGKLFGKGVSYCATCDGPFFKNKIVTVVGGGDAALTAALLLAEYSPKIYIIYRKDKFYRAQPAWVETIKKNKKIEPMFNEEIIEIIGKDNVEEVKLKSGKKIKVEGVFIEVGSVPETEILKTINVKLSEKGYVVTDKEQKTNIEGFFAAGDVTENNLKQIITACSEGAIAAYGAYQEIRKKNK